MNSTLWRRKAIHDGPVPEKEARTPHQTQLEQRHLEVYMNMHRLRDALYSRYAKLLEDKVHSQRLQLQQRNETLRAKSENETERKKKKLAFSKLQHNDSYLKPLPKSSYYLIFGIQKQLSERGHLKTHQALEDFYNCLKYNTHPSQLQRSLQDFRKNIESSSTTAQVTQDQESSGKHLCSRGRVDCNSHSRLIEQKSRSEDSSEKLIFDSEGKDRTEQMFPKIKEPTFATLQPDFMRTFQSKLPDLTVPEIPEKSRKAEIYMSLLRQMYSLSLTNMAFTQRLLDRETDSLCWQEGRGAQDLAFPGTDSKQEERSQPSLPPPCLRRMTSASQQSFKTLICDAGLTRRRTADPLSTGDACQQKARTDHWP